MRAASLVVMVLGGNNCPILLPEDSLCHIFYKKLAKRITFGGVIFVV
jgi:hypothetical protein